MHKTARLATIAGTALALMTGAGAGAAAQPAAAQPAAAQPAGAASSSPWSQTDYNAAQSGANLTETTLTVSTASKIRYLRSVLAPPSQPTGGCFNGSPVIAPVLTGGSLYAIINGVLTKYDAATGRVLWRRNPDPSFSTDYFSLAVAGGQVVVGGEDCGSVSGPVGSIVAFNAATGARAWTQHTDPNGGGLSQLVVSGGFVVVAGTTPADGNVVAVHRLATGALVWVRVYQQCAGGDAVVVAQVVANYKCSLAGAETLVGDKLATGTLMWSRPGRWTLRRGDTDSTAGRHVFVTDPSGAVESLDPLTGKTQYTLTGAANVAVVDNTQAYGACGTSVCAYNSATGAQAWQASPPGYTGSVPVAEAGGLLYLNEGIVLNAATGQALNINPLWNNAVAATSLVVGDGRIAAVSDNRVVDLYGLPGS